eukprot:TRINITY_DN3472_c0_g2_i1.p1 TRINITY_DN3472_c0_g2~~TRINITY_DN3472_c0_g2_i1.p1  ORF type:complete len:387 (-),score=121.56 TRINITY_DN3472_c0_g2_i1:145-1221(-)
MELQAELTVSVTEYLLRVGECIIIEESGLDAERIGVAQAEWICDQIAKKLIDKAIGSVATNFQKALKASATLVEEKAVAAGFEKDAHPVFVELKQLERSCDKELFYYEGLAVSVANETKQHFNPICKYVALRTVCPKSEDENEQNENEAEDASTAGVEDGAGVESVDKTELTDDKTELAEGADTFQKDLEQKATEEEEANESTENGANNASSAKVEDDAGVESVDKTELAEDADKTQKVTEEEEKKESNEIDEKQLNENGLNDADSTVDTAKVEGGAEAESVDKTEPTEAAEVALDDKTQLTEGADSEPDLNQNDVVEVPKKQMDEFTDQVDSEASNTDQPIVTQDDSGTQTQTETAS